MSSNTSGEVVAAICLVHKFIAGANLTNCLRNRKNPSYTVLSLWLSRMQIATNLTYGFNYIYHFVPEQDHLISKQDHLVLSANCHLGTAKFYGETQAWPMKLQATRWYM
ncbi:hypothetical protein ACFX14_040623 [Malus domestica]